MVSLVDRGSYFGTENSFELVYVQYSLIPFYYACVFHQHWHCYEINYWFLENIFIGVWKLIVKQLLSIW